MSTKTAPKDELYSGNYTTQFKNIIAIFLSLIYN